MSQSSFINSLLFNIGGNQICIEITIKDNDLCFESTPVSVLIDDLYMHCSQQ